MNGERVHYRERQPLRAADLVAEQRFRLAQRHRHDHTRHRRGIVSGLALVAGPAGLVIQPGLAIDGDGRGLVVENACVIGYPELYRAGNPVDVWLLAEDGRTMVGLTPAGNLDQQRPEVYLGRVTRAGAGHDVSAQHRRYAGLTGWAVVAPDRRTRMNLDAAYAGDPRRFVIATGPDGRTERIRIDRDGRAALTGNTVVRGVRLEPHGGRPSGLGFPEPADPPEAAAPWRISRIAAAGADTLRVEIGHPGTGGDPALHTVAIGTRAKPLLTTSADGITTVHGHLSVGGGIVEGPVTPDISDPRLGALLLGAWSTANATAGLKLDERYRGALTVTARQQGQPNGYGVSAKNTGKVPLGPVVLAASAATAAGQSSYVVVRAATLAVGATLSTSGAVTLPPVAGQHRVEVTAVAVGVGPADTRFHQSTSQEWTVVVGPQQ